MTKTKKWIRYAVIVVLTLAPFAGWLLWANHVIGTAEITDKLIIASVVVPGSIMWATGMIVGVIALLMFWVWLFDGDWRNTELEADDEQERIGTD